MSFKIHTLLYLTKIIFISACYFYSCEYSFGRTDHCDVKIEETQAELKIPGEENLAALKWYVHLQIIFFVNNRNMPITFK